MVSAADGSHGSPEAHSRSANAMHLAGIALLVLAVRISVLCVGFVSVRSAPVGAEPEFNRAHPWIAWDAQHYYEIALNGYSPDRIGKPFKDATTFALVAYFPLVPLTSRAIATVMPLDLAMVVLSNVCSLIGLTFVYDWARRLTSARTACICVLIVATFPGAVAFAAGMSEGPFLMLVAITLWLLQQRRFWSAAIVTGVATAVRPTGVALAALVPLYALIYDVSLPMTRRLGKCIALGLICGIGILCYELFLWHRYESPRTYFEAQAVWPGLDQVRQIRDEIQGVHRYSLEFFRERIFRPQTWNRGLAVLMLGCVLAGVVNSRGVPRILFAFPLIVFVMTALPDQGLRVSSMPRYESAALPLFLLVSLWISNRRLLPLVVCLLLGMFAMQLYYAYLFPREIWVG